MKLMSQIFPVPRECTRRSEEMLSWPLRVEVVVDPSLPEQGYRLELARGTASIACRDAAGERYARDTLRQLEIACPDAVPELEVLDWPEFPVRGYMLDISRDRVPTRETLAEMVRFLSRIRINHLQLYTEHTFAYQNHPSVWQEASPITAEDIRWLDVLCREAGIELAANQNCFGHMGRWLKHEEYRDLAEAPDGWKMSLGIEMPASVLRPVPESLALVTELLDELTPHFSSRRVNINCDETFELGKGFSAAEVKTKGLASVYLSFVRQVVDHLQAKGKEVLFWGDVLRNHPELLEELPDRDLVALVWHYEAPSAQDKVPAWVMPILSEFGMTEESLQGFVYHVRNFATANIPFWVCPGPSSWNSLVGRLSNARANLEDAARVGADAGASGYLITDWGDNGHMQPFVVSMLPLIEGAGLSWCRDTHGRQDLTMVLDQVGFAQPIEGLGRFLERLGSLCEHTGLTGINGSPLHEKLVGGGMPSDGTIDPDGIRFVLQELEDLMDELPEIMLPPEQADTLRLELAAAMRLARQGAWILAQEAGLEAPASEQLAADLVEAIEWQRAAWLRGSRPGGLEDSLHRLHATVDRHRGVNAPEGFLLPG
jgi:hexosaminidase